MIKQLIKKVNYILNKKQKKKLALIFVFMIIASMFELLGISAILPIVSVVLDETMMETNQLYRFIVSLLYIQSVEQFVLYIALFMIAVYVIKNLFLMFEYRFRTKFAMECKQILATRLMKEYISRDYLFHVAHNVADLQRNLTSDVGSFFNMLTAFLGLIIEVLTCGGIIIYLLVLDSVMTVALGAILGVFFVFIYFVLGKIQVKCGMITREKHMILGKWLLQCFAGIKEIKTINREKYFYENYAEAYLEFNKASLKSTILARYPRYFSETILISGVLGILCVKILIGTDIKAFTQVLSGFAFAAIRLMPAFNRLTEYMSTIMNNKVAVDNVYKDLKEVEGKINYDIFENVEIEPLEDFESIVFEDVTFKYPNAKDYVLDKINISMPANKSIAIVGESGAGKTTLVDILLGVLKPEDGRVLVGDVDIVENSQNWHATVSYIPQVIYLMDDTIRENVCFGIRDEYTDEQIWRALEMAQLDKFVRELPKQLDTRVGDRGVMLSGGQRQRIGIARALLSNPKVLIMDEATSALDNETEKAVMETIEGLYGNMTVVIIAHRLTTIQNCDYIYEVKDKGMYLKHQSKEQI